MKKSLGIILTVLFLAGWSFGWLHDSNVNNITVGGHALTYQATAPTVSNCGVGASVQSLSSDFAGAVTAKPAAGNGATTTCQVIFNTPFVNSPICLGNRSITADTFKVTADTTAMFVTTTANLANDTFNYHCIGNQ
jgi:hypothetical protein